MYYRTYLSEYTHVLIIGFIATCIQSLIRDLEDGLIFRGFNIEEKGREIAMLQKQ